MNTKIIGLTGPNGAGKGEVSTILEQKGFMLYSVRKLLIKELKLRSISPIDRVAMAELGTKLRKERGPEYFVSFFMAQASKDDVSKIVIDSIRNPLEAKALKDAGGILISIDADRWIRYRRIMTRDNKKQNEIPFAVFCLQEDREMVSGDSSDLARIAVREVMDLADFSINNSNLPRHLLCECIGDILTPHGVPA